MISLTHDGYCVYIGWIFEYIPHKSQQHVPLSCSIYQLVTRWCQGQKAAGFTVMHSTYFKFLFHIHALHLHMIMQFHGVPMHCCRTSATQTAIVFFWFSCVWHRSSTATSTPSSSQTKATQVFLGMHCNALNFVVKILLQHHHVCMEAYVHHASLKLMVLGVQTVLMSVERRLCWFEWSGNPKEKNKPLTSRYQDHV